MGGRIIEDTTNFYLIEGGDRLLIEGKFYKVLGHAYESQFGIDDPKFWVIRAIDLASQERKIIKLSFFETFITTFAGVKIRCFRSPEKEATILKLTKENPRFMKGKEYRDVKGNNIRVLDVIRGKNYVTYIDSFRMPYDRYFNTVLPEILRKLIGTFKAIQFLHSNGFRHGDIRSDHVLVERESDEFIWIDFDYDFEATENPFSLDIFGLGTILAFTIGKGFHTAYGIKNDPYTYGDLIHRIDDNDFSILDNSLFFNLKKLYPIIPKPLNDILMFFSKQSEIYYELVNEIVEDLNNFLISWIGIQGG